jgi:protein-tyrosine phosphatase
MPSLLFVCLGNICRSPTAEGVMRHLLAARGLSDLFSVDSAGTGAWHAGQPPDARATRAAARRGIPLSGQARQVRPEDFERFDLVLAMDRDNLRELLRLAGGSSRHKVRLLRDFQPGGVGQEVPDPYYGGEAGFEEVLDICEAACAGLLAELGHP